MGQRFARIPLALIEEHPENPNIGDVIALNESIETNGFFGAVTVRELEPDRFQLLSGNHRYRVWLARGEMTIPAIVELECDDERARRILLAANEITRRGRTDPGRLAAVLRALPDIRGTGFPEDKLEALELYDKTHKEISDEVFERQYGIVLECDDEEAQQSLYEWLTGLGVEPTSMRVVSI